VGLGFGDGRGECECEVAEVADAGRVELNNVLRSSLGEILVRWEG
jgi:hypothetical protein